MRIGVTGRRVEVTPVVRGYAMKRFSQIAELILRCGNRIARGPVLDADTQEVNVLNRRYKGELGLIEPRLG